MQATITAGSVIRVIALLRCLLIDDNQHFLSAARGLLGSEGLTIVGVASTSVDAVRLAEELAPDVLLIDIDLGCESGFELAERLHTHDRLGSPAMILVSTHSQQDYADLIEASPAIGFIPKAALSGDAVRKLLSENGRQA